MNTDILLVDDQIGDIEWLIDFVESRGYTVDQVTNEEAARRQLEAIEGGRVSYKLAIIDIMVSIKDIMDLVDLDEDYFEQSRDTGIRLCRYARNDLKILDEDLPIVCLSARGEDDVRDALDELGIQLFSRTSQNPESSIRSYLDKNLPKIK